MYLIVTVSTGQSCDTDIERRIRLAAGVDRRLGKTARESRDTRKETMMTLYKMLVQSVVIHAHFSISLRPNVDESPVSAFRLRPKFRLKSGLRPNRRREVKFGLKFGLRPKFSLRL